MEWIERSNDDIAAIVDRGFGTLADAYSTIQYQPWIILQAFTINHSSFEFFEVHEARMLETFPEFRIWYPNISREMTHPPAGTTALLRLMIQVRQARFAAKWKQTGMGT